MNLQSRLQELLDEMLTQEHHEMTIAKDWLVIAHVNKLSDDEVDEGTISVLRSPTTSIFTAIGLLQIATETQGTIENMF